MKKQEFAQNHQKWYIYVSVILFHNWQDKGPLPDEIANRSIVKKSKILKNIGPKTSFVKFIFLKVRALMSTFRNEQFSEKSSNFHSWL